MKIGIGITTFRRPQHLAYCLSQIRKHSPSDIVLHVADDNTNRKGVFQRKNECLKVLYDKGCDYFFLLDDDVFPLREGWLDHYIQASLRTKQQVLVYNSLPGTVLDTQNGINRVFFDSSMLMFLTRKAVKVLGGFHKVYLLYGYGQRAYLIRASKAKLNTYGWFLSPVDASKYVYALDIDRYLPINKVLKHAPSMTPAEKAMVEIRNRMAMISDREIHQPL